MDRFVSNTINRVDKKGRVSIPAPFRSVLGTQSVLHTILSVERPVAEAGGEDFMRQNLARLAQMDPLSEEYEMWSLYLLGDAEQLKIDPEGRIVLSDNIREHTGITDAVAFSGMGSSIYLWEPERFRAFREEARDRVREMRRALSPQSTNSPEDRFRMSGSVPPTRGTVNPAAGDPRSSGGMGKEGQET